MSILAVSALSLALAAPLQQPIELGAPKAISHPGGPIGAFFSADGTKIWAVEGAGIVALDRPGMTACELLQAGACSSDDFDIDETRVEIDAPILDIEDLGGTLYIAGGDAGVIRVAPNVNEIYEVSPLFEDPNPPSGLTRRWCFDVEITASGSHLLALFSAMNDSRLFVLDLGTSPPSLINTISLPAGRGYAVDSFGYAAYLAMGTAGLWKIDDVRTSSTGVQGPFGGGAVFSTIRDVAVAPPYRYLYAAGDSLGLIEVDLTQPWNSQGSYQSGTPAPMASCEGLTPGCASFGFRVEALPDPTSNRLVVVLVSSNRPIEREEWGPYCSYSTFRWDENNPYVPLGPIEPAGCGPRIDLYERQLGVTGWAQQVLTSCPKEFGFASLDLMREANGRFWALFGDYALDAYARNASGNLISVVTSEESNVSRDAWFGLGTLSLRYPDRILFGRDGSPGLWGMPGIVHPPSGGIKIEEVAPPCPANHISLSYGTQWTETEDPLNAAYPYEWGISSGFQCPATSEETLSKDFYWALHRINASHPNTTWQRWGIHLPDDPVASMPCNNPPTCAEVPPQYWAGFTEGFGYNFGALDPRPTGDLLAISRRAAVHGAVLYSHSQIQELALENAGTTCGPDFVECPTELAPDEIRQLETHPTLDECSCYKDEIFLCRCTHTQFFQLQDHLGHPRWVLGLAAGWDTNPLSSTYNKAKFVFFDVTSCEHLDDFGCANMPRSIVSLDTMSGEGGGFAFSFDAATIDGISYLFLGDFAGRVLVADATHLFDASAPTPVELLATWSTPLNCLDLLHDRITSVRFDPLDLAATGFDGHIYLASNRLGLVRLNLVKNPTSNAIALGFDELVETPGQVVGMAFGDVDGKRRLILGDHLPTGLRAYGEF